MSGPTVVRMLFWAQHLAFIRFRAVFHSGSFVACGRCAFALRVRACMLSTQFRRFATFMYIFIKTYILLFIRKSSIFTWIFEAKSILSKKSAADCPCIAHSIVLNMMFVEVRNMVNCNPYLKGEYHE